MKDLKQGRYLRLGDEQELVGRKGNLGKTSNSAKSLCSSNQFLFVPYFRWQVPGLKMAFAHSWDVGVLWHDMTWHFAVAFLCYRFVEQCAVQLLQRMKSALEYFLRDNSWEFLEGQMNQNGSGLDRRATSFKRQILGVRMKTTFR